MGYVKEFRTRWDLRAAFLFVMSLAAVVRGWAYRPGIGPYDPPGALRFLPASISLDYWAWLWISIGVFGIIVAVTGFKHPEGARAAGFALMAMGTLWGLTYIAGYIDSIYEGHSNRDWFSGAILICTAVGTAIGALLSIRLDLALKQIETLKADQLLWSVERAAMQREIEALRQPGREQ